MDSYLNHIKQMKTSFVSPPHCVIAKPTIRHGGDDFLFNLEL